MSSVESGYAEVNDTKLYYEVAGQGRPLVLIHGGALDTRMWDDQFTEFSKLYRVIRYDVRGCGRSSVPEEGKPYSHFKDLKELLNHLSIGKANIIGLSMGGSTAINFTLEYPEYVSSLIPVDSALFGFKWRRDLLEWLNSIPIIARESGVQAANEAIMSGALFEPAMKIPLVADRLQELIGSHSGWTFLNDDPRESLDTSPITRLHEIDCPTLVVVGEYDSPSHQDIADKINNEVSNSRKVVIPKVGHMSNMEDPETFNKEVLSFLESIR